MYFETLARTLRDVSVQKPLAVTKNGCLESTCAQSMRESTVGGSSVALHTRACAEYHMWQRSHSTQRVAFGRQLLMGKWPKYDSSTQPKVSKHYRATFERPSLTSTVSTSTMELGLDDIHLRNNSLLAEIL